MKRFLTYSFSLIVLCVFSAYSVQAQSTQRVLVSGKVIDAKDKGPVIGASIIEQDRDKRTVSAVITDIEGNFALRITNPANKLVIVFIGYATRTFDIGSRTQFGTIALSSSSNELDAVIVQGRRQSDNGTGLKIDTRDQTTTTVTISAKDIENLQATSIDQAVQGRLPGVDIVSNSGDPGAGMSIRIRGTSTINGDSNPLIVVDGVPYETSLPPTFNFSTADQNQYADLLSIAPSDIKDISVLKDAAATAVWGSRAANGVLIINTKRGVKGAPSISYTFRGSLTQQPKSIPLLTGDQYSTLMPEMVMNVNGLPLNTFTVRELAYNPLDVYNYMNYGQNTNWIDVISREGYNLDNNLSISGGGERASYFASVGYNNQEGTTIGTGFTRINTRLNLDYNVSEKIRFSTSFAYTRSNTDYNFAEGNENGAGSNGVRARALLRAPNTSVYEYNELGVLTPNYFSPASNIQGAYPAAFNPLAMAEGAINNLVTDRVRPQFNLRFRLSDIFTASQDVVFDITNGKRRIFVPQIATGRPFTENIVNFAGVDDYDSYNVSTKTDFIFNPRLSENHILTGLISLQSNSNKGLSMGQSASNSPSIYLQQPGSAGRVAGLNAGMGQSRSVAALVNAQYKYMDRYILNVALRGDGSSRFGPETRYGLFPSISARYRLSDERFMKKYSGWLDDFSFRGGYGVTGRAPRYDYLYFSNYVGSNNTYLGMSGLVPQSLQLNNLKWEEIHGLDGGFTMVMFKNRLSADFGFYRNLTKDLYIDNLGIPSTSGFGSIDINEGSLENKGLELFITSTPYKSKNMVINFNLNLANNINTVKSISPLYAFQSGDVTQNGQYLTYLQTNNPLGSFYGYKFKGVHSSRESTYATDANGNKILSPAGSPVPLTFNYPQTNYVFKPGYAIYEDVNHDGNINFQDVVYLGNGQPKLTGGFGPGFTFKGKFSLQSFFTFRLGGQIINKAVMNSTRMYDYSNQSTAVLRRWRKEGDETDIPRALFRSGFNWLGSDRYVENGDYLRLNSITGSYTFDKAFAKRIRAKNLGVYFTAQNLATFTKYKGQDPEVASRGAGIFSKPEDNAETPPLRLLTLGLTASF